jgi:hypothetical protein
MGGPTTTAVKAGFMQYINSMYIGRFYFARKIYPITYLHKKVRIGSQDQDPDPVTKLRIPYPTKMWILSEFDVLTNTALYKNKSHLQLLHYARNNAGSLKILYI